MDIKDRVAAALKTAMRDRDQLRLSTLRLINAAIKDREIAMRTDRERDSAPGTVLDDGEMLAILGKMVKQRQESARAYDEGGRIDMAEQERSEIAIIEEFLPRQLSEEEVAEAIDAAIAATGAEGIRDMGRVMGALKAKYTGQMDFGAVSPQVKAQLT